VTPLERPFEEIWLHDFEFISRPGERPDVVCLCATELRSGRSLRLWRDQLGERPPYRTDRGAVFVNFVANAECGCHRAIGWPTPERVLDLSAAFRNLVNGLWVPEGKGLIGALRYYGLSSISAKQKDATRARIIQGWSFTPEERERILDYCASDAEAPRLLLARMLPEVDLAILLHHGEFAAVSARMEFRGVPIDREVFAPLADRDTWRAVRDDMVPTIDARYGVYSRNAAGDWTFNTAKFEAYLAAGGIAWPRLETGKINLRRQTFDAMAKGWPQLDDLRQLRHARAKMRKIKLAVGADNRNRTVLWPFKSKTGRTQPKAAEWIFSPAVWLRSLIKPEPGMAVAYVDYSAMEFLIAAVLSDGHCGPNNPMLDCYNSGDPYWSFAQSVGAAPHREPDKDSPVRARYKFVVLSAQYGIEARSLAARAGVSTFEAQEMLSQHRQLFAQYWKWSDDWAQHAMQTGLMRTAMGWACRAGVTEFNERSIRNWPVQSAGADILRIACVIATRRGVEIIAPIHDAVLLQAPIDRIEADVALMREIMRRASRVVLNADANGPHELRTDFKIIRYPDRFNDARGAAIWDHVLGLLAARRRQEEEAA
jgi:DNA polymerase I